MNTFKKLAIAAGLCAAGLGSHDAFAQTTDAYHTIQVFPIVVDTLSFTQRFTFRNPNSASVTISPSYFPGTGTAQPSAFTCPSIVIAANSDVTFNTLRDICPALAAGSNFGFLYTYETNTTNLPYSGFSRVANPQGNGFSVEAFAASDFTSATSVVAGVRRLAASGGAPAFQTNCFVANLREMTASGVTDTEVDVTVRNSSGTILGATTTFPLVPGKLTRLLDVFAAVGAPAGNHDNARVTFAEFGTGEPGIMSFCTVQDNTSFGADFRIAKQEIPGGGLSSGPGPQSDHAMRASVTYEDTPLNNGASPVLFRGFGIPAGGYANTHVMYFKHPDWVQCEILDPGTGLRAANTYGLEMRMLANDGTTVLGGGDDQQGFGEVYLGDKQDRNDGANTRYTIEVENNGLNFSAARPYYLRCRSGSGHSGGDMVRYQESADRF